MFSRYLPVALGLLVSLAVEAKPLPVKDPAVLEAILKAFCAAEAVALSDRAKVGAEQAKKFPGLPTATDLPPSDPERMTPREFLGFIAQLSISSMVHNPEFDAMMVRARKRFVESIWAHDQSSVPRREAAKQLNRLEPYGADQKFLTALPAPCTLSESERMFFFMEFKHS